MEKQKHVKEKFLEGIIYLIYIVSQPLSRQVFKCTRTHEAPNAPFLLPSHSSCIRAIWLWDKLEDQQYTVPYSKYDSYSIVQSSSTYFIQQGIINLV